MRSDLKRRAKTWQTVLAAAGLVAGDRVLVAMPLEHAVTQDAYLALLELDALSMVSPRARSREVREFAPTVLVSSVSDALNLALSSAGVGRDPAVSSSRVGTDLAVLSSAGSDLTVPRSEFGSDLTVPRSESGSDLTVPRSESGSDLTASWSKVGADLADGPVRLVVLTGEPGGSLEVTRRTIEDRWGATCLDVYALTELGIVGWSCPERRDRLHLDDAHFTFEALDPDSGEVIPDGSLGELVISRTGDTPGSSQRLPTDDRHGSSKTLLTGDRPGSPESSRAAGSPQPLRTGDLVRLQRGACACGRGSVWAHGGILGRVTERLPLRGQLVLPSSIEQVVRRHPAVVDFVLKVFTVRGGCEVSVLLEPTHAIGSESDLSRVAAEVAEDLKRTFGMRLHCDVVPPGSISASHVPGQRTRRLTV
ncbi:MAG: hypothetical protein JO020_26065 [Chloroflexi bacterium]|nr:hypothetical protein [Chloroflexota bacterium]